MTRFSWAINACSPSGESGASLSLSIGVPQGKEEIAYLALACVLICAHRHGASLGLWAYRSADRVPDGAPAPSSHNVVLRANDQNIWAIEDRGDPSLVGWVGGDLNAIDQTLDLGADLLLTGSSAPWRDDEPPPIDLTAA